MTTSHPQDGQSELAPSTHIAEQLPGDVEPLYESVDPDALDELFAEKVTNGTVHFIHAGYRIVVRFDQGTRTVVVEPRR